MALSQKHFRKRQRGFTPVSCIIQQCGVNGVCKSFSPYKSGFIYKNFYDNSPPPFEYMPFYHIAFKMSIQTTEKILNFAIFLTKLPFSNEKQLLQVDSDTQELHLFILLFQILE